MILAGVAISLATGQDSIFSKANEAASKWNESAEKEKNTLGDLIYELNSRSMVEVTDNNVWELTFTYIMYCYIHN